PWCLAQVTFGAEALGPPVAEGAEPSGRLGKYVRTEKLGSGGMGEVWKALDTELNRWVALKFLKEDEPAVVARFQREARTAAGLSHPGIAAIYEVGEAEGRRFIAMQYVPGLTMDSIPCKDRRVLVRLFRDVARALDHAHKAGVIHRDLKPANLIVEEKGDGWSVSILDFGLARPIEGGERLSKSGEVFGTVPYMSPEQSRGEAVDVRSDVYSLGATMYEVLSGRPPFMGANLVELVRRIGSVEPSPLRKVARAVDRDLETIVMACLQKDRRLRYPSARALAADLDRWLKREPILARRPSAIYRLRMALARRKAVTAAVAAGVALASVVGWWAMVGSPGAEQARLTAEAMKSWAEARGLAMAGVDPEGIRRRAKDAREAFERAIAVKEDAPSLVMKSRCLQLEGRDDDALKEARRAHALDPANAEARLELAKLLLLKYRELRSTPAYHSTKSATGKAIDVTLGRLAPESSEQGHLRQEAEKLLAQGGASPALASLLTGLLAMGREDYRKAAEALAAYTKLENWDARGFQLEGMTRFFIPDFQGAVTAFDQSLLRVPRGAGYRWRGIAKHFLGLHEQAVTDLTKAIELDRTDASAYDNRGVVLTRLGRFSEAISDCTKGIELNPKRATTYVSRGVAKRASGLLDDAIADYSKALEIDPRDPTTYTNRGTAKSEKGDLEGAIADYTRAIEVEPTYALAYAQRAGV
ncbi:MAG TPA: tetratricopeptide repeat protein, partial [Planctomycetota bacterium]|nr:tetratricopeptide repeat protein [Planctomycetota bacterium]